jgi:hypothetical protein
MRKKPRTYEKFRYLRMAFEDWITSKGHAVPDCPCAECHAQRNEWGPVP